MKFSIERKRLTLPFFALLFLVSGSFAAAQTPPPSRDRVVPKVQQTPTPKPTPTVRVSPSPSPTVTPTPSPTSTSRPPQTVFDLQAGIRRVLQNAALARGQVGVKIVSLDTGRTIFEENAEKFFMPASNMKSFTVAAALDRLSPDFRFVTSVYAPAQPDASGAIRGDVTIYGRGDPTFAASLNDGDYYKAINALADKIAATGVRRIEGNLIGDESYFSGDPIMPSWEWDDLQWYYGAGISALTINDNAVDLKITPGGSVGAPCVVQILPVNLFTTTNLCITAASGTKRELEVTKRLGANVLEVRGAMPISDTKGYAGAIAIEKPAEMFVTMLKNALQQRGITITGQIRTFTAKDIPGLAAVTLPAQIEIAKLESQPFSYVAAKTMKPSQNLYTELILRTLGEQVGDKTDAKKTSAERGLEVVQKFLQEAGITLGSVVQWDGSGLSRHNLITPGAAAQLYNYMSKHRYALTWQAAQTVGGVDGTLQNRFKRTAAEANVRGKTGTLDQVGTLSGYVTTAGGEKLVFSVLTNNLPDSTVRRQTMDEIVLLLANFNGKTN
jgi:serine-type D-Ala-D-Ala carboxypeptidase/endopeptidase (penicillin-binding protein 4)